MDYLHAIVLALVQGLTEFLPISSSAHLILVPRLFGWPDQGLAFDVAVHLGTLLAVLAYFRRDVADIAGAWLASLGRRAFDRQAARMGWAVIVATLPVVLAGPLLADLVETRLRSPLVIATTTALFGLLLWLADRRPDRVHGLRAVGLTAAFAVGLAQVLALVPGTSRSGITMTAGLALGLDRETAARFSFLIAIPAIAGAALLELIKLLEQNGPVAWGALGLGLAVAAVSAWLCIRLFLAAIQRIGMLPFVIYRLLLAAVILGLYR
ncbi:MAG: undecaprenyl-diphosphate phosphatase [Gammaproteobacteria bacterium]|nr:MAG: undecaprenyl-diphosphate phosphatase [Gammaproteobacteria bacterium]